MGSTEIDIVPIKKFNFSFTPRCFSLLLVFFSENNPQLLKRSTSQELLPGTPPMTSHLNLIVTLIFIINLDFPYVTKDSFIPVGRHGFKHLTKIFIITF